MNRVPLSYPAVISTVALLISIFTFYFANVREAHSLRVAVMELSYTSIAEPAMGLTAELDGVLVNMGNRPAVVFRAGLRLVDDIGQKEAAKRGWFADVDLNNVGPLVIPPGETLPIHLTTAAKLLSFKGIGLSVRDHERVGVNTIVKLDFSCAGPNGRPLYTQASIADLRWGKENKRSFIFEHRGYVRGRVHILSCSMRMGPSLGLIRFSGRVD